MPHFATLRDYRFKEQLDDIRGCDLYGVDNDKLGKIEDVVFEHGSGTVKYVVVDTGGWLRSKKFLVPADRIHDYEGDPQALQVDLVKEHIERYFPPYDENIVNEETRWKDYESRYEGSARENRIWDTGSVMHKQGSSRTITPEAADIGDAGELASGGEQGDLSSFDVEPTRMAGKFTDTAPGSQKMHTAPLGTERKDERLTGTGDRGIPAPGSGTRDVASAEREQHRHEGKVEPISTSPMHRPMERITDVPAPSERDSFAVPERADVGEEHRMRDRNYNVPSHPIEDVRGTGRVGPSQEDMHSRPERWRRFEELLRRNRVDIEAKCPHCAPAKARRDVA